MKMTGKVIGAAAFVGWVSMPAVAFEVPSVTAMERRALDVSAAPSLMTLSATVGCDHAGDGEHAASCTCARCMAPAVSE